jgi:hypothetical protein
MSRYQLFFVKKKTCNVTKRTMEPGRESFRASFTSSVIYTLQFTHKYSPLVVLIAFLSCTDAVKDKKKLELLVPIKKSWHCFLYVAQIKTLITIIII